MLTSLCIRHYAIVQALELDFSDGMLAFTGETGAGKSIIIDALMLALGGRVHAAAVTPGQEKCDITAGFSFENASFVEQWLEQQSIACEDGLLYLRRVVFAEGGSKAYVNGYPFSVQKVKELGEHLVHLHGQHQHQTLLQHVTHRQQLDHYAQHGHLVEAVQGLHKQYQQVKQKIDGLQAKDNQREKVQLLEFQLAELNSLDMQEDEMHTLHQEHQLLHHANTYLEHSDQVMALLDGDEKPCAYGLLHHMLQLTAHLPEDNVHVRNAVELLNNALIHCEEAYGAMQCFVSKVQLDPARLQTIETRMSVLHAVARKYHINSKQLPSFVAQLQNELMALQGSQLLLTDLMQQLQGLEHAYQAAALQLRQSRQDHAKQLTQEITTYMHQLGMPKGLIEITITPLETLHPHGMDKVEYKVCTNPGMPMDTLAKIVSGGELSRISLAIELVTAKQGQTPTLIFDEVDVGIGGATAALVGKMLRRLGERLQVFCVTHQAQVAACAHHHYQVEKYSDKDHTTTTITLLTEANKINEIARMLGGITITDHSVSHARELLEL